MTWTWHNETYENATEACAAIMADYATNDEHVAFEQRWEAACSLVDALQRDKLAMLGHGVAALSSADLAVVSASRRGVLSTPWPRTWTAPVTLYVVATDFFPTTSTPLPSGDVKAIDPSDEVSFLLSLSDAGLDAPVQTEY